MRNVAKGLQLAVSQNDKSALLSFCAKLESVGLTVEELAEINYAVNDADEVEGRSQLREKIEKLKQLLKEYAKYEHV